MKIKELIKRLQEYDQDMLVVVEGYEEDFSNIKPILKFYSKDYGKRICTYSGRYHEVDEEAIPCLVLSRTNEDD